jgi:hypothetical protein
VARQADPIGSPAVAIRRRDSRVVRHHGLGARLSSRGMAVARPIRSTHATQSSRPSSA